ncbi:Ferric reductase domain protein transmembrane component domain protein [Gloeocapsa sp. PCC 7428]|nr:Ferric reductase domain protein transmembrane component domain protein [Gloeocapsa sp. PCC 7428]
MVDLLLMITLGFLGSFGHCIGMCVPLTTAFSLSLTQQQTSPPWQQQFTFHLLLNLGRLLSYTLVGAGIGALGSVLIAGGQMAGDGSWLRQGIAILTGLMLIWFGIVQVKPQFLPRLPFLHPLSQGNLHKRLSAAMVRLSFHTKWWTPAALGIVWGLMPCGFLYAAQIKAAETGSLWRGAAILFAFGLGTAPTMLGVGVSTAVVGTNRRSQLYRLAGWLTIFIGVLTLVRTGDGHGLIYITGHGALLCLMLALIARPLRRVWAQPLKYRRTLGVGAFVLALVHVGHTIQHTLGWNWEAVFFMLPQHQIAIACGIMALLLITPAAFTSFDRLQKTLGKRWRQLHLLSVPALVLCTIHIVLIGSHYLGTLQQTWRNYLFVAALGLLTLGVLLVRSRSFWSILSLEKFYAPPLRHDQ